MAYKELIGHFSRVRAFMQHFYIYGFYTREEFACGSARSYDDERRRVEGWLGEHMGFRTTPAGKSVFISFDSRSVRRNPLYRALKSKSFTDRDITLHFLLLDVLSDGEYHSVTDLIEGCEARLNLTPGGMPYDQKTLRGKVGEFEELGLIVSKMEGKRKLYTIAEDADIAHLAPVLAYFTEVAPCGVIGSYLEDRLEETCEHFRMKHHHIAQTLDSALLCQLLDAIGRRCDVVIQHMGKDGKPASQQTILPLYILQSTQDGRSYLLGWGRRQRSFQCCRLDRISTAKLGKPAEDFRERREQYDEVRAHHWGVSHIGKELQHIEFSIRVQPYEEHVRRRLYRECRCGQVEELDGGRTLRFSADLYDVAEMLPWIRTFIGRITSFRCDNELVSGRFRNDLEAMLRMYQEEEEVQG